MAGFILHIKHNRHAPFACAAAAFSILIWIFVQMVFIPFSVLQCVYFAAGLAELGLLLLLMALGSPRHRRPVSAEPVLEDTCKGPACRPC